VNKKRPVNLDLTTLSFPPMAIASILHRISGVVLFVLLPVIGYFFYLSLESAANFAVLQNYMQKIPIKLLLIAFISALTYHLLAGIRHILMDLGLGEHLHASRNSALMTIIASAILSIGLGIWLW
tara:strand:+ start:1132 stop:1506 length:375 start_codon:yes stop_codon:yes gene_type:complete